MKPQQPNKITSLRTMDDIPLDGRVVLVRADFNVSVGSDNKVDQYEDYRLEAVIPTLRELQQRRCRIVLLTHLGEFGEEHDVTPLRHRLADLLVEDVISAKHLYGDEIKTKVAALEPGGVIFLPNVRSDLREQSLNKQFSQQLSEVAEVYVNEAFGVNHRAHASVAVLPHLLPSCAGRRLIQEVTVLEKLRSSPEHPYVAIVSGAKISTKERLIRNLLPKVDQICIGGKLANVFLCAKNGNKKGCDNEEEYTLAEALMAEAGHKILLPSDVVIGKSDGTDVQTVASDALPDNVEGVWDIGEETVKLFIEVCAKAKTVMWNGPLGCFEVEPYYKGTYAFAKALAEQTAYRVLGGGETVMALEKLNIISKFDHVSVGGGAMVTYLEGGDMPGLNPLYG